MMMVIRLAPSLSVCIKDFSWTMEADAINRIGYVIIIMLGKGNSNSLASAILARTTIVPARTLSGFQYSFSTI